MNTQLKISLFLIILISPHFSYATASNQPLGKGVIQSADHSLNIEVEIAFSRAQRQQGLMFRTSLGENQGMLFSYPDQAPRRVWMKDTLLSLDVLFLDHEGRIVAIQENLQPCRQDPCPISDSGEAAMYMLEVNAGYSKNHAIKTGDSLQLP